MFKKCLLILSIIGILPCFAGELENAFVKNDNVFLYLYTPQCGYCTKFTPRYNKLSKMYDKQYAFVKVDASSKYGYQLMSQYRGSFVPYVLLLNQKKKLALQLPPACLMDNACVENALKDFKK